jgi:phenylpropionate dioxygenase-like ring-hydroxylating dioxygenase large terminal subunit
VCPYHAWQYGLDGGLANTGDAEAYPELGPRGLVELPAAERYGLLWVKPEPGGTLDIEAYLGPLSEDFAAFGLESHVPHSPEVLPAAMNWKLMVDTFLEDTHFRFVHGRSVHRFYLDDASIYDRFGPHMRYIIPKRTILDLKGTDPRDWRLKDHANILYLLFPNTVMVFVADHAAIFAMFPEAPGRSRMELTFCLPQEPKDEKAIAYWTKNRNLIRTALQEDFRVGEGIQAGISSPANREFLFGRYEKGLQFFHQALAEADG